MRATSEADGVATKLLDTIEGESDADELLGEMTKLLETADRVALEEAVLEGVALVLLAEAMAELLEIAARELLEDAADELPETVDREDAVDNVEARDVD